jgi:type I restriction-modification system DNA methylase subunit
MDAEDFRDYMLSLLFLRYLSDNYETAAKKELGRDCPKSATAMAEMANSPEAGLTRVAEILKTFLLSFIWLCSTWTGNGRIF